jgi:hypothetical protein
MGFFTDSRNGEAALGSKNTRIQEYKKTRTKDGVLVKRQFWSSTQNLPF